MYSSVVKHIIIPWKFLYFSIVPTVACVFNNTAYQVRAEAPYFPTIVTAPLTLTPAPTPVGPQEMEGVEFVLALMLVWLHASEWALEGLFMLLHA